MKRRKSKIVGYRKSITRELNGTWTWACPVWFTEGFFADAWIRGTNEFDTQELASADMVKKLKLFGITKRTKNLNETKHERTS